MTPQDTFQRAVKAVANGDWVAFCRLLTEADVKRVLENAIVLCGQSANDEQVAKLFERYGFVPEPVEDPKTYRTRLKAAIKQVKDPAELLGHLEAEVGIRLGRRSFSSRLFQNEKLEDVVVDGKKATARRVHADGSMDAVAFALTKEGWRISLVGRRTAK
jgi:hypothetical protein